METNKLIADFMGLQIVDGMYLLTHYVNGYEINPITSGRNYSEWADRNEDGYLVSESHLEYNASFDWLIPAIEKISAYRFEDGDTAYPRTFGMINEETGEFMFRFNRFQLFSALTLIEAAYKAVVDFIEWFNEQNIK